MDVSFSCHFTPSSHTPPRAPEALWTIRDGEGGQEERRSEERQERRREGEVGVEERAKELPWDPSLYLSPPCLSPPRLHRIKQVGTSLEFSRAKRIISARMLPPLNGSLKSSDIYSTEREDCISLEMWLHRRPAVFLSPQGRSKVKDDALRS